MMTFINKLQRMEILLQTFLQILQKLAIVELIHLGYGNLQVQNYACVGIGEVGGLSSGYYNHK